MIEDYNDGAKQLPEDCMFKISPSSIGSYFSETSRWYRKHVLKQIEDTSNKGQILGTIVHYCMEQEDSTAEELEPEIEKYIKRQQFHIPDLDVGYIRDNWKEMFNTLIPESEQGDVLGVEEFKFTKIYKNVYLGGTYDLLLSQTDDMGITIVTLVDHKTSAKKPSRLSKDYWMQLMTYAYLLKKNDVHVDKFVVQYVSPKTKTLPPRVTKFEHYPSESDYSVIEGILTTVAKSVHTFMTNKSMQGIIAQDGRLDASFEVIKENNNEI